VSRTVGVIGVPTSAGSFAPGQEQAPAALRAAGLVEALERAGVDVRDHGDRPVWRWRPDRERRDAQNVEQVVEIVRDTARRVGHAIEAGEITVVLGGDCTVGIGTVAGHVAAGERLGLAYFDAHADLNVPASVREGALDWMGMAHMLGEEGAVPDLVEAGPFVPMLRAEQVVLLAWDPEQATAFEREVIDRRRIRTLPVDEVAKAPERAAARAHEMLAGSCDRVLIHFDVDVVDFTDMPLSENTGRNEGLAYVDAIQVLLGLLDSPRVAGLTITELNPDHAEEGSGSIARLAAAIADGVARAAAR
jgi:arginase